MKVEICSAPNPEAAYISCQLPVGHFDPHWSLSSGFIGNFAYAWTDEE